MPKISLFKEGKTFENRGKISMLSLSKLYQTNFSKFSKNKLAEVLNPLDNTRSAEVAELGQRCQIEGLAP